VFRGILRPSDFIIPTVRLIGVIRGRRKFLQKSIDTLLRDQLKGATSPALAGSAAGELTRVEIKNREKIEKSVDPSLAFPLEAAFHIQTPLTS
jgi:hypothetical protein